MAVGIVAMIDLEKTLADLRAVHLSANRRRAQTAIDVPAAVWLWQACDREKAEWILELGSGFSSWVIRHWQQHGQQHAAATRGTEPRVITLDDESKWLETTLMELREQGFGTDSVEAFQPFVDRALAGSVFDIVFVDLDNTRTRINNAERFVHWTKPGGILVLDDWHMPHYRGPMTDALAALGVTVEPIPETTDEWGRYLAAGRRPAA